MAVDYEKFIHPFDRAMLKQLKSIPMLDSIVKKVMAALGERIMRGMHEASYTKLSLTQLPEYYKPLLDVCDTLGIEVPDMYLAMNPQPNAYTFGDTKPFIVINHGLIKLLTPEELKDMLYNHISVRDNDSDAKEWKENIDQLRAKIDILDESLLYTLSSRMNISRQIGEYKRNHNIAILQTSRWDSLLAKVVEKGEEYGLPQNFVKDVFNAIHEASVEIQNEIISGMSSKQ